MKKEKLNNISEIRGWVRVLKVLPLVQALYYLSTGIWPLLHLKSFLLVTGPKNDIWLLYTVAVLIIAIAVSLLYAYLKNELVISIIILAVASAISLTIIDVYYATKDIIRDVYLLDAVFEVLIIIGWGIYCLKMFRYSN